MSYNTAPRSYFQAVIESMRKHGFEFMAWVTMNSRKNRYHVDFHKFSQGSRLFFIVPGGTFIVMLELTEHFGMLHYNEDMTTYWEEDYYQAYWSGFICYSYSWRRMLEDHYAKAREEGRWVEWNEEIGFDPDQYMAESPFRWGHSSSWDGVHEPHFEQNNAGMSNSLLDPEVLTRPFGAMLQEVRPFLYRRFRDLQVTDFAPHYTFRRQEPEFWSKFPLHRLKSVANRIWGSDFN